MTAVGQMTLQISSTFFQNVVTSPGNILSQPKMKYLDDNAYIEKVRSGDVQAYAFLVNKHKSLAFTLALRIVKNREDAEEVAQDAFLKAFNALPEFKGESKFSTWLYRIIYNNSINKIRKSSIQTTVIENDDDEAFVNPEEELKKLHSKERIQYVKEAIDQLEEDEGALVTLFYMDDQPVTVISEVTGLTEANVRVKLHRARKKMQLYLQQRLNSELKEIL